MFPRRTWLVIGLAGAIAIPYLFSSTSGLAGLFSKAGPASHTATGEHRTKGEMAAAHDPFAAAADATPVVELPQALRFDVTTAWVLGRWPRVSAGLAQLDLQGYRVPLVTGTKPDDLAGSLTYYFNRGQRVEQITFDGTTGDARRLVAHLATQFGFVRRSTDDAGVYLYQVQHPGKPPSELRIEPARIVRADSPHSRFEVSLVMHARGK
jgi:hypothetical protein